MQHEILEVINKNLPSQVGDALKKELSELAALRQDAASNEATRKDLAAKVTAAHLSLQTAQTELKKHADLNEREAKAAQRELKLEISDLKVTLLQNHHAEMIRMFETVFKGPVFQRTLSGSIPVSVAGTPGNPQSGMYPSPGTVQSGCVSLVESIAS